MNALHRSCPALSIALTAALVAFATAPAGTAETPNTDRIQITFDAHEAEAVLAIVTAARSGSPVDSIACQRLFEARPYIRLKARESEMHRDFTDDEFKQFVLSPALAARADSLRRTLDAWKQ